MNESKTPSGAAVPCIDLLVDRPFYARYKQRDPDPGVCRIVAIDWEDKHLSMSNGRFRYSPSFDEVEIVPANAPTHIFERSENNVKSVVGRFYEIY